MSITSAELMRTGPPEEAVSLEPYAPGDVMPAGDPR